MYLCPYILYTYNLQKPEQKKYKGWLTTLMYLACKYREHPKYQACFQSLGQPMHCTYKDFLMRANHAQPMATYPKQEI